MLEENMDLFRQKYPKPFHKNDCSACPIEKAKIEFSAGNPTSLETVFFGITGWGKAYAYPNFLVEKAVVSSGENQLNIRIVGALETADSPYSRQMYGW